MEPSWKSGKGVLPTVADSPDSDVTDGVAVLHQRATTSADSRAALQTAAHRICPGCGTELVDRGCKMRCLRCGFFLDCSDG